MLNPQRELIAYYPKRFINAIGNKNLNNYQQIDLMIRVCRRLQGYHEKGKIHANLHPTNIMFTHDFKVVDFMDSLPNGNKGSFYSSP
jgi:tRNA A-37 threonylcarbamoyl transferase component Bud32